MTFDEWFQSKQGQPYYSYYDFAKDAWYESQEVERIKHQSEIQRLTTMANTAEKWRGIAMARDGDGMTVQEVWNEAAASEREACLNLSGEPWCLTRTDLEDAIRARGTNGQ